MVARLIFVCIEACEAFIPLSSLAPESVMMNLDSLIAFASPLSAFPPSFP